MSWAFWALIAYACVGVLNAEWFLHWSRTERDNTRLTESWGYLIAMLTWPMTVFILLRKSRRDNK